MSADISYPYMPIDRTLKYVPHTHPFMQAALIARENRAGDSIYPVGIVMVKHGQVVATAGNGFDKGSGTPHICPRIVLDCKSGEGYELCSLHDPDGHAESCLLKRAVAAGIDPAQSDVYMYGHWWACEPCWQKLIAAGVRDLYVTDDAHVRFCREKVLSETLTPSVKSVYISGALSNLAEGTGERHKVFYEELGAAVRALGINAYIPHLHSDPERHPDILAEKVFSMDVEQVERQDCLVAEVTYPSLGTGGEIFAAYKAGKPVVLLSHKSAPVSRFVRGNPSVVYHIEYETYEEATRMLQNVLKQL